MSKSPELYDYLLQDIWQLTVCVILGYLVASAFFTVLLYPAYVWDPENSFSGEPPGTLGMGAAVFCMSLCALSQTAVNLTDLAPTSTYTISVVVLEHFVGVHLPAWNVSSLCTTLCSAVALLSVVLLFSLFLSSSGSDTRPDSSGVVLR